MLMPSKVKYRKQQRGRRRGKAQRGSSISFGDYGLKSMESAWVTARQIEASRVAMTRFIKRVAASDHTSVFKGNSLGKAGLGIATVGRTRNRDFRTNLKHFL